MLFDVMVLAVAYHVLIAPLWVLETALEMYRRAKGRYDYED